ncbi:hypothetical protein C3Y89_24200 [Rhizobium sp. UPM1132]|uniref:hypothetical protein n=1 Tax=Rhizobium ruizarguesonis TaxID=2081791 RepID=UPI00144599D3|nr:hypothetical protein [Rhizobium ruizarguesonis]NKQ73410.1 hypothetical protein [Rhizobium ruizarguesonis]
MQIDTLPEHDDERFPEKPEGHDALLKEVVDSFFNLWACQDRIAALQAELLAHPDYRGDRTSLDLVG